MAEMINFKVFLFHESLDRERKPDIRRFGIDFDVFTNYTYLCEKLQTVFPELRGQRFSILWKDSEDDDIIISSCEELEIALTEMQNDPIRKFYVTLHSEFRGIKSAFQSESARATGPANKEKHVGIVCDGCDKDIFGFGYKCLRCVDYDLCTECEAKGSHPEHCMIRFPTPLQRKLHKGKCLFRPIDVKVVTSPTEEDANKKHSHKHRRHGSGQNYHHNQVPSWLNTLTTYLNDWTYLPEECPAAEEFKRQKNNNRSHGCPIYSGPSREPSEPSGPATEEKPAEIRVNVQSKTEEKRAATSEVASAASTNSRPETAIASSSKQQAVAVDPTPTAPLQEQTVTSVQQNQSQASSLSSSTSEPSTSANPKDDWTLIDDLTTNTAANLEKAIPEGPVFCSINEPSCPSITSMSLNEPHPDPKIQSAVEAMIQMGFSNESGWLTQLVCLKDGDISQVLDILHPVNPKNK